MSWGLRRKLLYIAAVGIIATALFFWLGASLVSQPATCFDHAQNQGETGVDCGGPCSLLCSASVRAPIVSWVRSFAVSSSTYTAAAYIQNPNTTAYGGARGVHYAFRLFDENNSLVTEIDGTTDILPMQITPIIIPNIDIGARAVSHAFLDFSGDITWQKISTSTLPVFRITGLVIASDGMRVSAVVNNESNTETDHVAVFAVLFDSQGNAQAASKTVIDRLPAHGSQAVTFTWPQGISNIVSAEITPVPSLP